MDIEDKELFESATNDEPIEVAAEEPVAEVNDGPPRDDQGRFAPKAEEAPAPEPVAAEPQGKDEAYVPSWRLRELREEREAAIERANRIEESYQRQLQELQARLPKQEPAKAPDVFEDPNAFLQHGVQQAVDPINSKVTSLVENFSKKWAIKEHGAEKVDAAYAWMKEGMLTRNPEVMAIYQRAMSSDDPYEHIVAGHQKQAVFSKIGNDPDAWFQQELERRMADPQFTAAQLQRIQSGVRTPSAPNQIKLPPSIGRVPSSQAASDDAGDMSDGSLFAHAIR